MRLTRHVRNDQRGATLIEMALSFPLIVLMLVGILELGVAFKDYLSVSAASREGARIAALAGTHDQTDCAVLTGIADLLSDHDLERIDRIEIFKYDPLSGTQDMGETNVAVLEPANDPMVCEQPHTVLDGWLINPVEYTPAERQTTVGITDLDIVGVRVILTRDWITGFPPFRGGFTIDESTLTRLEPEVFAPSP